MDNTNTTQGNENGNGNQSGELGASSTASTGEPEDQASPVEPGHPAGRKHIHKHPGMGEDEQVTPQDVSKHERKH